MIFEVTAYELSTSSFVVPDPGNWHFGALPLYLSICAFTSDEDSWKSLSERA